MKSFKSKSVPLGEFLEQHPGLAESVIDRNDVKPADVKRLHVSFVFGGDGRTEYSRSVTAVLLTTGPVEFNIAGVGASIKSPMDSDTPQIGVNIALARAVRDAVS